MPNREQVKSALAIIKTGSAADYFFDNLSSPGWLTPLDQERVFDVIPATRLEGGYVAFPSWAPGRYLARIAGRAPEQAMDILVRCDTDNPRVQTDLVRAALSIPARLSIRLLPKVLKWLDGRYSWWSPLGDALVTLVVVWAEDGRLRAAFALARALLALSGEEEEQDASVHGGVEPRSRFRDWDYPRLLSRCAESLARVDGQRALKLTTKLLEDALAIRYPHAVGGPKRDYSFLWRATIEDNNRMTSAGHDIENALVSATRDVARQWCTSVPGSSANAAAILGGHDYPIFRRLALNLLLSMAETDLSLAASFVVNRSLFDEHDVRHEYNALASVVFARMDSTLRDTVLSWIGGGPRKTAADDVEQGQENGNGNTEAEERADLWRFRRLSPLREYLEQPWKQLYGDLEHRFGEPASVEMPFGVRVGFVVPRSPKSSTDFDTMSVGEIVHFLIRWEPSEADDYWSPFTRDAVGEQLQAAVASDPAKFTSAIHEFVGVPSVYVQSLVAGLDTAVTVGKPIDWSPTLDFCSRALSHDDAGVWCKGVQDSACVDNGRSARITVARLINRGFESKEPLSIPLQLRQSSWGVLEKLLKDPDPTPDGEADWDVTIDAATLSLNTVRGVAMHAAVAYGLWLARYRGLPSRGQSPNDPHSFADCQELRSELELHLDTAVDLSLAVRAVYGWRLPSLFVLDARWTQDHISVIFPGSPPYRDHRDASWRAFLKLGGRPSKRLYEAIAGEYSVAVDELLLSAVEGDTSRSDERRWLADHVMALYWHGFIDLGERGLLRRFFENADVGLRQHALDFVGRLLTNVTNEMPLDVLGRVQALWEYRVTAVTASGARECGAELAGFGWWFVSGKLGDEFSLKSLTLALQIAQTIAVDHKVAERLAMLASSYPDEVITCVGLMIRGDKDGWHVYGWRDSLEIILRAAANSESTSAREMAQEIANYLAARDYREYSNLRTLFN